MDKTKRIMLSKGPGGLRDAVAVDFMSRFADGENKSSAQGARQNLVAWEVETDGMASEDIATLSPFTTLAHTC